MADTNDSTRQRILTTAGPIFAEKGFRDATVRDICDKAKVNLASVNYYFGDKHRLYLEAVKYARETNEQEASGIVDDPSATPDARLRGFVLGLLRRLGLGGDVNWQTTLLMRELLNPGEATKELVSNRFRPQFKILTSILGDLSDEKLSESQLALSGLSVIGQCLFYRLAKPMAQMMEYATVDAGLGAAPLMEIERLADHIASFSSSALRHNSPDHALRTVPR